jgi:hypothetical protein
VSNVWTKPAATLKNPQKLPLEAKPQDVAQKVQMCWSRRDSIDLVGLDFVADNAHGLSPQHM